MNEHDDDLARALGRSLDTIPVADPDVALARVTARSRVVKRRRTAVRASAAVAVAAVVGAVWLGARTPGTTQVDTVDTPSVPTAPTTGTDGTSPTTPVTTGTPTSSVTSVPASTPSSVPQPTVTAPPTAPAGSTAGGTAPATTAGGSVPPPAAPTTQAPPPSSGPQTYGGLGGQVTVRVNAGNLVLVGVQPSPGFVVTDQKAEPDDVEVRFEGAAGRTRVRIRMENGVLSPEVREDGPS
jgi:hypothetical protein